jgi:hypothetical protein
MQLVCAGRTGIYEALETAAAFDTGYQVNNVLADFYRFPELPAVTSPERYSQETQRSYHSEARTLELSEASSLVDDLRLERYSKQSTGTDALLASEAFRSLYYRIRPALSDSLRQALQRFFLRDWGQLSFPRWPVDTSVEDIFEQDLLWAMKSGGLKSVPFIWFWPDGASSAAVMTHDVEASSGLALVPNLIDIDDEFAIKASFQLVPEERYEVSAAILGMIQARQCEVNVHGLNHDGNLFRNRKTFLRQSQRINHYIREFAAEGFRSACMYRRMEWYKELQISYDMSVPNVAHLEPQRGGCCTVFPYFIGEILELPLTTVQDYSLFHILGDYSIDLWKRQIELIAGKHGLVSFIVHPDYIFREKALPVYKELLAYLSNLRANRNIWIARPGDVNRWWRERNSMKLVLTDSTWHIEGPGRERARVGFACLDGDEITYKVGQNFELAAVQEFERGNSLNGICS